MQYIPNTEEIRLVATGLSARYAFSFDEFDAWLAEHDQQVKAEAWDEGFTLATRNNPNHPHPMAKMNPYRTEDE